MEHSDDDLRRRYNIPPDVPVERGLPTIDAGWPASTNSGEPGTIIRKIGYAFGYQHWMKLSMTGRVLALLVIPPAIFGVVNFWGNTLEVGFEHAKPYLNVLARSEQAFSTDRVVFREFRGDALINSKPEEQIIIAPRFLAQNIVAERIRWVISRVVNVRDLAPEMAFAPHPVPTRFSEGTETVTYASLDPLLAIAEIGKTIQPFAKYTEYALVRAAISAQADILDSAILPAGWDKLSSRANRKVRGVVSKWVREQKTALLRVPSILDSAPHIVLINPEHPDAQKVTIPRQSRGLSMGEPLKAA